METTHTTESLELTAQESRQESVLLDVRALESPTASEFYINAIPRAGAAPADVYSAVARTLRMLEARIAQERLFASPDAIPAALRARSALGSLDDGVPPTVLAVGPVGQVVGVQVHAVRGVWPLPIAAGARPAGRTFELGDLRWLTGSGLQGVEAGDDPAAQAGLAFGGIEKLLARAGTDLFSVARTWVWMDRILDWYDPFNQVRTNLFRQRGMLANGRMPASTGIGVSPAGPARCAIDCFAAWGAPDAVQRFHAAGKQRAAFEYGSAFARSASTVSPAGRTVFCSGTAAIDTAGNTCHVGGVTGQIQMTIDNVHAVLSDMNCRSEDVVQAMAYCATDEVQSAFLSRWRKSLPWPCLTMRGDVCRHDLLFEVEVTAIPGSTRVNVA